MAKLLRKKDHQAFLGVINEGQVVELQELSSQEVSKATHLSKEQKTVLQKFYEQHGAKVDQFVDNLIDCKVSNEEPKLAAIRNRLYLNSNQGKEPFERMYQRTTFTWKWTKESVKPQVLIQNIFNISDLVVFGKMLNQPGSLFIQNTFKVTRQ